MNAREMFKKLGYKYNKYRDRNQMIEYRKEDSTSVLFWIKERKFSVSEYCEPKDITVDEFKAIQQQLNELGWLEEETCTNKPYKKLPYKLSKWEYDILDTIFEKEARFSKMYLIGELKKNGYFENIKCDSNVRVKDILANCEVIK